MELSENKKLHMIFTEGANKLLRYINQSERKVIENTIPEDKPIYNVIRFQDKGLVYSITQICHQVNDTYSVNWVLQNVKQYGVKINLVNMRRHGWVDELTNPLISQKDRYNWFRTNDKKLIVNTMKIRFNHDQMIVLCEYDSSSVYDLFRAVVHCTECTSYKKMMQSNIAVVYKHKNEQLTKSIESIVAIEEPIEQLKELFDDKYYSFSAPMCCNIVLYNELHYAKVDVKYLVYLNTPGKKQKFASIIVVATIDTNTFEVKYDVKDKVNFQHIDTKFAIMMTNTIALTVDLYNQSTSIYGSGAYKWTAIKVCLQELNDEYCNIKQAVNYCTTEFKNLFDVASKLDLLQ